MIMISNRNDCAIRGFSGRLNRVIKVNKFAINIAKGATNAGGYPIVNCYKAEVLHEGFRIFEAMVYDVGTDDDTYQFITDKLAKLTELSKKPTFKNEFEVSNKILNKMFTFLIKQSGDGFLISFRSIIENAYTSAFEDGKAEMQASIKSLLNISEPVHSSDFVNR